MPKMLSALCLLVSLLACSPEPPLEVVDPGAPTPATAPGDTARTILVEEAPTTYAPMLGVNITWANDQRITDGGERLVDGAVRHVRYFQMMEKDYGAGQPATTALAPCTDLDNPWSCPETSMRQHLVRVKALREMFPEGVIWIAPEVLAGRSWPCKGWTADELGADPEAAGYAWGRAAFATYGQVPGVIVAMTNEEWCPGAERANAYNAWRRGVIRAHRANPSCEIAIGARHVRMKQWQGERLTDHVGDVASDVWTYVDEVGGWADYHAHGIEDGRFLPRTRAAEAADVQDFYAWSAWLDDNYPDIRKCVGEIAYTSSAPDVVATAVQKQADFPTYAGLIRAVAVEADLVFLYQFEDHARPEGAFSGTGIYPALMQPVRQLGQESRVRAN